MPAAPFPVIDEAIAFPSGIGSTAPYPYWLSLGERSIGAGTTRRGRQYELDAVQAGEFNTTLLNKDGALNPANTGSPFAPNVIPSRPYRYRAQWPPTQQLLLPDQATMGDATGIDAGTLATDPRLQMSSAYDALCDVVVDGAAVQGTRVMLAAVPGSPTAGLAVFSATGWSMTSGVVHSFQAQVRTTSTTGAIVRARLQWVDATGALLTPTNGATSTLSVVNTWVPLTVSGSPPANAAGCIASIVMTNSVSMLCQTDKWQVEVAAAPSTWIQPGTWY